MALILDTNALFAAADRDPSALEIVAHAEHLAVPVIVLGEYRLGIAQSRHQVTYENWLRDWVSAVNVLDVDEETTHCYAAIGLELKNKRPTYPRQRFVVCRAVQAVFPSPVEPRPAFRFRRGSSS